MPSAYAGAVRTRLIIAVLACALAAAGPAAAALPSDLSADPLDRGALLALPSVYRVDVTIEVEALRLSDGTRVALPEAARRIGESGTAVAVAPGGWLVTAAHVAAPDGPTIARLARQYQLAAGGNPDHADEAAAAEWVRRTGAVAVGPGVTAVTVGQASADAEGDLRRFPVLTVRGAGGADLALVRIRAPRAPALDLDEGKSSGTPVVAIGFGVGSAFGTGAQEPRRPVGEPAIRRGTISRTGVLEDDGPTRNALAIDVPVVQGDSGGPVVDADGRVRGIVTRRSPQGGIAELATEVRQLLDANGVASGTGASADRFREGMTAFWDLDFAGAQAGLAAARREFPPHALAGVEGARAAALADGEFTLTGRRRHDGLLAVGVLAVVAALACAVGLLLPVLRDGGRGTTAR